MEEITFSSLEELYKRLEPALRTKKEELKIFKIKLEEYDIWKYLVSTKWKNAEGLLLHQMVDDIINLDPYELLTSKNDN